MSEYMLVLNRNGTFGAAVEPREFGWVFFLKCAYFTRANFPDTYGERWGARDPG